MSFTAKIGLPILALALAMSALVLLQPADAAGFSERVSGNFIDTSIDTNGDGTEANFFSGAARGSGNPTYEGLVEIAFSPTPTGVCGADIEGSVVAYSIVRRYSNGDLQLSKLVDGSLCFNPATGTAAVLIHAAFAGGTGRYDGSTGTYTASYTVKLLVPDPAGGIGHGAFYGTVSG